MPFIWNVGPLFLGDSFLVIPSCIEGIISSRNGVDNEGLEAYGVGRFVKEDLHRPSYVCYDKRAVY